MSHATMRQFAAATQVSPLVLSDRLITLAQAADRAGYTETAEHLIELACRVCDEAPPRPLAAFRMESGGAR